MAHYDDVKTSTVALVGLIGAIVTFAVMLLVMVLYQQVSTRLVYDRQISQAPAELSEAIANQEARLAEYRWVDQPKGVVAIPIERAMELVVSELSSPGSKSPEKNESPPDKETDRAK